MIEKGKAIASGVNVARKGIQNIEDAYYSFAATPLTSSQISRRLHEAPTDDVVGELNSGG